MNTGPRLNLADVGAPAQAPMFENAPTGRPAPADDPAWADRGSCRADTKPDRWITLPELRVRGVNNPAYRARVTALKTVCGTCPVNTICLGFALDSPERLDGVWGGTDEYERADLLDTLDLPQPGPAGIPALDGWEAVTDASLADQFTGKRYAHRGYSNKQIAALMGTSPMTVGRFLSGQERSRGSRRTTKTTA